METAPAGTSPAPRKRRKLKIFLRVLAVVLVLLAVTVCLAPTLLSTGPGKGLVEGIANDYVPGSLKIGSLSLGWFGGQTVEDIQFQDADGNSIQLQEFSTELTLWKALFGDYHLGKTRLHNLDVNITVKEPAPAPVGAPEQRSGKEGKEEEERKEATPSKGPELENLLPRSLILNAELTQARITVKTPQREPVVIENLELSLTHEAKEDPLAFRLSGRSRQGELAGSFTGKGEVHGMFGEADQVRAQVGVAVKDLPTDGVDGLLGLGGVLSAGLGPMINVQVDTSGTTESQDLSLQVNCANLVTRFKGRVEGGSFALTETGTVTARLTPELLQKVATSEDPHTRVRLSEPLPIQWTLDRFSLPVGGFDPSKVAMDLRVEAGAGARLGDLEVRRLAASLSTKSLAKAVRVTFEGDLAEGAEVTTIRVNGEVADLLDAQAGLQLDKLRLDGKVAIAGLSMALADRLLGQDALAQDVLGPRVGVVVTSSFASSSKGTVKLDLEAPNLQLGTIALELTDRLTLSQPVVLRASLSKELFARFVESDPPIQLRESLPVELTIHSVTAPRPQQGEPMLQPERTKVEATLTTGPVELSGVPELGDVTAKGARLTLGGTSLAAVEVQSSLQVSQPAGGLLDELTGTKPLAVRVEASGGLKGKGVGAVDIKLGLDSPRLVASAEARVAEGLTAVSLKETLKLRLIVWPGLLEKLGAPGLADPTTILVTVDKAQLPLGGSMKSMEVEGSSSIEKMTFAGDGAWSGSSLHDTRMTFALGQGSGTARVEAKASVPGQEKPGSLTVDAKVTDLLAEGNKTSLESIVRLDGLPTAFVDGLANQGGKLEWIGPTLGIEANARLTGLQNSKGVVEAKVRCQNLTVDAGLQVAETLQLSRPVKVKLVLTPEGYKSLTAAGGKASPLVLQEPATIEATIQSLRWPQAGGGEPRVVKASVKAARVRFQNRESGKTVSIEGLTAAVESADVAKDLQVKVAGNMGEKGKVSVSLGMSDLLTQVGEVNVDGLSAGLKAEARELPVAVLDAWLGLDGLLLATCGEQLTVTASSTLKKMNGPVEATLQASKCRGSLDCSLQDNVLRLNKPLAMELDATKELGQKLLGRLHPFLKGISAGTSIKLRVNSAGVDVPLENFDIGKLVVPETTVDIGKVTLEADVLLEGLMALAKRESPKQLAAWFTPAVFSIRNGRVTFTKRMDVLFDKDLHVATWGSADLRTQNYWQTLALTGPTLAKHFSLDNISPEEMFRIPIRGRADAPRIDYTKAGADLGRLKAEDKALSELTRQLERLPPIARGFVKGQVKAAARRLAGALGGDQGPVPPASATPLPWK